MSRYRDGYYLHRNDSPDAVSTDAVIDEPLLLGKAHRMVYARLTGLLEKVQAWEPKSVLKDIYFEIEPEKTTKMVLALFKRDKQFQIRASTDLTFPGSAHVWHGRARGNADKQWYRYRKKHFPLFGKRNRELERQP